MNKLKKEILEYVEAHAKVDCWEERKTKEKMVEISLWYPDHLKKERYYCKLFFDVCLPGEKEIKILPAWFEALTEEIIKDLEKQKAPKVKYNWKHQKTIYQVCPERFCGVNPCSCEEDNHA